MLEWYSLLVPIAVLAVLLLFRFVGCSFQSPLAPGPYVGDVETDSPVRFYEMQEKPGATTAPAASMILSASSSTVPSLRGGAPRVGVSQASQVS